MKTMLCPSAVTKYQHLQRQTNIFKIFTGIMDKTCGAIALFNHIVACRPVDRQQLRDKQIYNSCC
jgi:hypothetical protein